MSEEEEMALAAWVGSNPHTGDRMPCMLVYPVVPHGTAGVDVAQQLADVIDQSWGLTLGEFYAHPPALDGVEPVFVAGQEHTCWAHLAHLGSLRWPQDPRWAAALRERGYACVCITTCPAPRLLSGHAVAAWCEDPQITSRGVTLLVPLYGHTVHHDELTPRTPPTPPTPAYTPAAVRRAAQERQTRVLRRAAKVRGQLRVPTADALGAAGLGIPGSVSDVPMEILLRDFTGLSPSSAGTCYSCGCPDEDGEHVC